MMSAQKLREDFQRRLMDFQEQCSHPKSEWMPVMWAPGHSSGYSVKICEICEKELERSNELGEVKTDES